MNKLCYFVESKLLFLSWAHYIVSHYETNPFFFFFFLHGQWIGVAIFLKIRNPIALTINVMH
jgi:hypothetical protein